MTPLSILLVEDEPGIADYVRGVLGAEGWSVTHHTGIKAGLAAARAEPFDVFVFDRMLPDGEGLDMVEALRAAGIGTPVLMLTALSDSENKVEGYRRGADDYLVKPFEPPELIARITALMRRASGQVRSDLRVIADLEIHTKARTAHRAGTHLKLSPREFDLLLYFADNAGSLITRDMLLRDVWNMGFDPGTNVVDVNIGRLRKKLDGEYDTPLLRTVRGLGFEFGPDR
ncbi:MAG: response regulator transcription factor [Litorimonas sp.]